MERRFGLPCDEGASVPASSPAPAACRVNRQASPGRPTADAQESVRPRSSTSPRKMSSSPCEPVHNGRPSGTVPQVGWTSTSRPPPTTASVPLDEEARLAQYEVIRPVGAGRFGEVFIIRHKATDAVLCWKLVFYKGLREKEKKQLVSEVNVMRELRHPNIVRYHDRIVCRSKQCLYIVMEYCDAGDLAKQIEAAHKHHGGIDQDRIVLVVVQLIHALAYCHEGVGQEKRRVLHRDLKPCNIFLASHPQYPDDSSRCIAKLGDFGLSRHLNMHSMAHSCVGTPYYWSPELLEDGQKTYNVKSDLWALGCVIYEMCTGKTPFSQAQTLSQLKERVRKGPVLPIRGFSDSLNALMASLLQPNPNSRPSALQCLGYTIFRGCPYTPPPLYSACASARARTVSPSCRSVTSANGAPYSGPSTVASTRHSAHSSSANEPTARHPATSCLLSRLPSGVVEHGDSPKFPMQPTSASTLRRVSAPAAGSIESNPASSAHPQFQFAFPSHSSSPEGAHSQSVRPHGTATPREPSSQFEKARQSTLGFPLSCEREVGFGRNVSRTESRMGSDYGGGGEEGNLVGRFAGSAAPTAAAAAAAVCAFEQHQGEAHADPSAPLTAIQEEEEEGTLSPSGDSQLCAATTDTCSYESQPDGGREKCGSSPTTWVKENWQADVEVTANPVRGEKQEHRRDDGMPAGEGRGNSINRDSGTHSSGSWRTSAFPGTYSVCCPGTVCPAKNEEAESGAGARNIQVPEAPVHGREASEAQQRNAEGELGHRAGRKEPGSDHRASGSLHGPVFSMSPASYDSAAEAGLCRRRSEPLASNLRFPEDRPTGWQAKRITKLFSFAHEAQSGTTSHEVPSSSGRTASPSFSSAFKTALERARPTPGPARLTNEPREAMGAALARPLTAGRAASEHLTQQKQPQFQSPVTERRRQGYGPGEGSNERSPGRRGGFGTPHASSPHHSSHSGPYRPSAPAERGWGSQRDVQYKPLLPQLSPPQTTSGRLVGAPASPYECDVAGLHAAVHAGRRDPKRVDASMAVHRRVGGDRPDGGGSERGVSDLHRQKTPVNPFSFSSVPRRSSSTSLPFLSPCGEFPGSSSSSGGGTSGSRAVSSVQSGFSPLDSSGRAAPKRQEDDPCVERGLLSDVAAAPSSSLCDLFRQQRRFSASPAVGGVSCEEEPFSSAALPTLLSPRFPPPEHVARPDRGPFPFSASPRMSLPARHAAAFLPTERVAEATTLRAAYHQAATRSRQTIGGQDSSTVDRADVPVWSTRREEGGASAASPGQLEEAPHRMQVNNPEVFGLSGPAGEFAGTPRARPKAGLSGLTACTPSPGETFRQTALDFNFDAEQTQADSICLPPVSSRDLTRPTTASSYCETPNGDWEAGSREGEGERDPNQHSSSAMRFPCSNAVRSSRGGGTTDRDTAAYQKKMTRQPNLRRRYSDNRDSSSVAPAGAADEGPRSSIPPRLLEANSSHTSSLPARSDTSSARPSPRGKRTEPSHETSARPHHVSPGSYTRDTAGRPLSVVCSASPARRRPDHRRQSPTMRSPSDHRSGCPRETPLPGWQGVLPRESVPFPQKYSLERDTRGLTGNRLPTQQAGSGGHLSMDQQPKVTRRVSAPTALTVAEPTRPGNCWDTAVTESAKFSNGGAVELSANYGPLNTRKSSFSQASTDFSSLLGEDKSQKSRTTGWSLEEPGADSSSSPSLLGNPARSSDHASEESSSYGIGIRSGGREPEWGLPCRVSPTPRHLQKRGPTKDLQAFSAVQVSGPLQEVRTGTEPYFGALKEKSSVKDDRPRGDQLAFQQTGAVCRMPCRSSSPHVADAATGPSAGSLCEVVSERQSRSSLLAADPARDKRLPPQWDEMADSSKVWIVSGTYENPSKGR